MDYSKELSIMNEFTENAEGIEKKLNQISSSNMPSENIDEMIDLGENIKTAYDSVETAKIAKRNAIKVFAKSVAKTGIDKKFDKTLTAISKNIGKHFSKVYSECNRVDEKRIETLRGLLDEVCDKYFQMKGITPINKSPSSTTNTDIESYSSFRGMIKDIDVRAAELDCAYKTEAPRTKTEAKRMLKSAEGVSASYTRILGKHIPQTKMWLINPHKAYGFIDRTENLRTELKDLVANFDEIKKEERQFRSKEKIILKRIRYMQNLPESLSLQETLKVTEKVENQATPKNVTEYEPFKNAHENYVHAVEEFRQIAQLKRDDIVGSITDKVEEAYKFTEAILEAGFESVGYETNLVRAKQRIDDAKSDLNVVKRYTNTKNQLSKYNELSAAVYNAMSTLGEQKQSKQTGLRIKEKEIELESAQLEKNEKIRRMELDTAQALRQAKEVPTPQTKPRYCNSSIPKVIKAPGKRFYNLYSGVMDIEAPESENIGRLGRIIEENMGNWDVMLLKFGYHISTGKLNGVQSPKDKNYLHAMKNVLQKSMANGTLTGYLKSPEVKTAADSAVKLLDDYIASHCEKKAVV